VSMLLWKERTVRPVICSMGSQNSRTLAYWEEDPRVAQALVLAHLHEIALRRGKRVLQETHQRVIARPERTCLCGTTPELTLVEPDHGVRHFHQDASAGLSLRGLLLIGGHAVNFLLGT
jgi:hypothetical protein